MLYLIYSISTFKFKFKLRCINKSFLKLYEEDVKEYIKNNNDPQFAMYVFIILHMWRAEQGSQEWLDFRRGTIGASEVSAIFRANKYKKIHELAYDKVYGSTFTHNRATTWGNLCEDIIESVTANIFGEMYHTGSIPGITFNNKLLQSASPDGLGIVEKSRLLHLIDSGIITTDEDNIEHIKNMEELIKVLYEFKVPLTRQPTKIIPEQYKYQIQTGMDTCNCDISIFGDCLLRKCSTDEINFEAEYDNSYNKNWHPLKNIDSAKYFGFIGFSEIPNTGLSMLDGSSVDGSSVDGSSVDGSSVEIFSNIFHKFQMMRINNLLTFDEAMSYPEFSEIDYDSFKLAYSNLNNDVDLYKICYLGDSCHDVVEEMIESVVVGNNITYYSPSLHIDDDRDIKSWWNVEKQKFIDNCLKNKQKPLAIMPYKILDISYVLEVKQHKFREELTRQLIDFNKKIDHIKYYNIQDIDVVGDLFEIKRKIKRGPRKKIIFMEGSQDDLDALFD